MCIFVCSLSVFPPGSLDQWDQRCLSFSSLCPQCLVPANICWMNNQWMDEWVSEPLLRGNAVIVLEGLKQRTDDSSVQTAVEAPGGCGPLYNEFSSSAFSPAPQPQTQPSLRPPPVFGDPEEKDYYHLLLLPALPDILQFTLSTSYPLSGSLPLSLGFKELKSKPAIYTSLTQANSVAYRWWMQLSPPLAEMLATSLNFVWKKETMAIFSFHLGL